MVVGSNAKLNLGLRVVGKRPDGYHEIRSLFQEIDFGDQIELTPLEDGRVEVSSGDGVVPNDHRNLAARAALLLQAYFPESGGVHVSIQKHVPVGAGLGGGSSNAAATLVGLNGLWSLGLETEALARLGLQLGSDVPFFVRGGAAVVSGRGDVIEPVLGLRNRTFVLAHPGFAVETAWAYSNLEIALTEGCPYISFLNSTRVYGQVDENRLNACVRNDFQPIIETKFPQVLQIIEQLKRAGGDCVGMTGSGSVFYASFEDYAAAEIASQRVSEEGYQAWVCRPVPA